ncbi:hypothetical protein EIN_274990 [Entamoeba invadens IP1]|uniref:Protein kinase domain-containing protein n=1 Tax=Entamoeba invadens IP1 TaxID=370355 RepID=A0A0A1U1M3_ENTIV|nr:hypothetical protein EIN_274990 [Entamoeba invadens IP1]ELP87912.1 hypothetical protein EIN_274990 [Entamoeba invadens IP1]|eukprot:XP_004254683.1 hypothetical protein EIN_274990 [Entamoeba invadens IP1]
MKCLNGIICHKSDSLFYEEQNISCSSVTINMPYARQCHTSPHQLLIEVNTEQMCDSQIDVLLDIIAQYKELTSFPYVSPVVHFQETSYPQRLYILTPQPFNTSIQNYFEENNVTPFERNSFLSSLLEIASKLHKDKFEDNISVAPTNFSIALFEQQNSPFPQLALTPLSFILKMLSKPSKSNSPQNTFNMKNTSNSTNTETTCEPKSAKAFSRELNTIIDLFVDEKTPNFPSLVCLLFFILLYSYNNYYHTLE